MLQSELAAIRPDKSATARYDKASFKRNLSWRALTFASALALGIVGLVAWFGFELGPTFQEARVKDYGTSVGEQKTVLLSDKSSIRLNTDSLIEVVYEFHERRVRLVKGEALFDVAKDENRPFIVYAGADTVRAVGTEFSVRLLENDVKVLVSKGKVALNGPKLHNSLDKNEPETAVLTAKETATIAGGFADAADRIATPIVVTTVKAEELERSLSWTTGTLDFDGEPLEQVIAEVSRYTPLRIRIAKPELGRMPVAGRFRIGETKALFDVIKAGFGAKVVFEGPNLVVITSG